MEIYTCVLLDVDNTILDFDAAERQALTDMLAEYELPHDEAAYDTYHKVNRELWDSLAKGQLNKQKLFQIRFSRFMQAMQLPDNGKGKAMNDRYEELLATHADLLPGALTALEELDPDAYNALRGDAAVGDALPRPVRHRVHHRGGQTLDAADPGGQAHRLGRLPDRRRVGGGEPHHAR